jgi:ABC-type phosphate/phosphonate transport system permease subunit
LMEEKEKAITIKIPSLNIKKNFWKILSIILLLALVGSIYVNITGKAVLTLTQHQASSNEIGKKVIDFINSNLVQPGTSASLISVKDMGSYFEILTSYQGQQIPVYASKDGKILFLQAIDITQQTQRQTQAAQQQQAQEIPKRDRPTAELYIFSYCPYGVVTLDSFAIVGKLLSNKANMKVKFFSDMHGKHELQQNMIQECIQEVDPQRYWEYASKYLKTIYSKCASTRDINCDKNESITLMKEVGIDVDKVMKCVEERGEELYNRDISDAERFGLKGSPSLVINEVHVIGFDRSPEGIKRLICSSFIAPPDECSQVLSASSPQTNGSC